jgi:hypothetical protein
MSRTAAPEGLERDTARAQLVGSIAAKWARTAAAQTFHRIQAVPTDEHSRELLEELAFSIVAEAQNRFPNEPSFAEYWREAANEAACAQLTAGANEARQLP